MKPYKKTFTIHNSVFLSLVVLILLYTASLIPQRIRDTHGEVLGAASPDSSLSLTAPGVSLDEFGNYLFPSGQVDVVVNFATGPLNKVDGVEAIIHYDPTILSATAVTFNQQLSTQYLTNDAMKCNPVYIDNATGTIRIARTAIPLPAECPPQLPANDPLGTPFPPYTPIPVNTSGPVALIKFTTLQNTTTPYLISYEYKLSFPNPNEALNDSNATAYIPPVERTGVAYDTLSSVSNLSFVVGPQPVPIDDIPPVVDLTAPINGATLSGSVNLTATATDNKQIAKVEFTVDGVIKCTDTTSPYECTLDTTTYSNGTTHTITAKAYDTAQPDPNTAVESISVNICNGDCQAPTAPTNLTTSGITYNNVNLTWAASTDNVAVTGYNVFRRKSTDTTYTQLATVSTTTYADTSVSGSTTYKYLVKAVDAAQNVSEPSNTADATTPTAPDTTPPSVPANVSGSAVSTTQINVTWSASVDNTGGTGIDGYNVYRKKSSSSSFEKINSTLITGTSYGDSNLAPSTNYDYYITAVDKANNQSAASSTITVKTKDETVSLGNVYGAVFNQANSQPLANVKVQLSVQGNKITTYTDALGKYSFLNVTPGSYVARYQLAQYGSVSKNITVTNGRVDVENVYLSAGGR